MGLFPFRRDRIPHSDPTSAEAAVWLARRDRGLTPLEQDQYLQWLRADPRHAEAVTRHAAALERMMQLYSWQPANDSGPNPDLFTPPRRRVAWKWHIGLAAAAAMMIGLFVHFHRPGVNRPSSPSYLHINERLTLPDGSQVELKDGSNVVVQYSATERRVKLTGGEAHFSVWKESSRPFYVEAGGVEVRAVGTAFNVRLGGRDVEVLVVEGKVRVQSAAALPGKESTLVPVLSAGERAVVALPSKTSNAPATTVVAPVTVEEMALKLDWRAPRLQFHETSLADAVAEFNRLNHHHQIVIADPDLDRIRIGGTFRSDNVDGFVRLLNTTLGINSKSTEDGRTLLRR